MSTPELTAVRDLVHQGVGRNVLQFQRLELLLKHLLGCHQGIYHAETFEEAMRQSLESKSKTTLGTLAGEWFGQMVPNTPPKDPALGKEIGRRGHRFNITLTEADQQRWQAQLKALVEERNHLVHKSLLNWDLDTPEGCQAILTELDAQRERIRIEWENVKKCHEVFLQVLEQMQEKLETGDVKHVFVPDTET
jgi:hypothetical protein